MTDTAADAERPRIFDEGLQPERTALAWRRTGLAPAVVALVAMRTLPEVFGAWAVVPAGLGLGAAVGVLVAAHRRHTVVHRVLVVGDSNRVRLPSGLLPFTVAGLVIAAGVAALGSVVVHALG